YAAIVEVPTSAASLRVDRPEGPSSPRMRAAASISLRRTSGSAACGLILAILAYQCYDCSITLICETRVVTAMSNRYLETTFAPVREEVTLTELTVSGALPNYL